ncbi:hypothetical protein HBH69_131510 [Parastagonospora nodorum]|nr:hypothetical protein HBH69_131510 [Parastagonospora nodorum]
MDVGLLSRLDQTSAFVMPEPPSPESSGASENRSKCRRGNKRSYVACKRCHSLKVKCSGGTPCLRCSKARKEAVCQYPSREKRVTVPESYLQQLQRQREHANVDQTIAENGDYAVENTSVHREELSTRLPSQDANVHPSSTTATPTSVPPPAPASAPANAPAAASAPSARPSSNADVCISNVDANVGIPTHVLGQIFASDHDLQQQFIGESTCSAFSDRILQCLYPDGTATNRLPGRHYVRNATFSRQMSSVASCKFPDRIRATLLVRVAFRFVGQDYHMFMQQHCLQHLEQMYGSTQGLAQENDNIWVCKFFVILALGELYSTTLTAAKEARSSTVAGTEYFLTAVGLLQDLFEEPSIDQIETLLLFSFYSNALGRVKSAHMYSGMALRSSTVIGLHRQAAESPAFTAIEREHRRRLWWTVYIFDRSTCSKLGQPVTIQDSDIDVAVPSTDGLSLADHKYLGSSADHLIAFINLAKITGYIMNDVHVPSAKVNGEKLVKNVRSILGKLRNWDSHVPARLRWDPVGGVPRSVASLQLHFNQCIILTTRPILLYVFKLKNPFADDGIDLRGSGGGTSTPPISDTIRSLADSCVTAARTSNAIIVQLFVENALATCGYFDAHHLFSSTIVLIVSAISYPNASDSDAVQTAFQLLVMMRDNGNAIAGDYFARLLQIQGRVSHLFTRATADQGTTQPLNGMRAEPGGAMGEDGDSGGGQERFPSHLNPLGIPSAGSVTLDEYDWSRFIIPSNFYTSFEDAGGGNLTVDPLDHPLLQTFLDNTDGSQDENNLVGAEHMEFVL